MDIQPIAPVKISTGKVKVSFLVDEDTTPRVVSFDPTDLLFAEKFYRLGKRIGEMEAEFNRKAEELDKDKSVDANGLPANVEQQIALMKDFVQRMRDEIDVLFGEGTSQAVFGNAYKFEVIGQFLDGITPYFSKTREEKVAPYLVEGKTRKRR